MDSTPIHLGSYLDRIGIDLTEDAAPNLETLKKIQFAHACSVPFENLDVLLNKTIDLDSASIQHKTINAKRGGYCFEQNGLMLYVLKALGFDVQALSARVRFGAAEEFIPPRTHLFNMVKLDGVPWLVDVGVGGLTATMPIRIDSTEPQMTPHDTRRIRCEPGKTVDLNGERVQRWFHQVLIGDQWLDVYEFSGENMPVIDREVANWWTSTNSESKFRQRIMVAIAGLDGSRHSLSNRKYTHRLHGEVLEQQLVGSSEQLLNLLSDRFGIVLPADTRFGIDGL
jgi:N-hydroxyarylamine O-acetyltransferase